MNKPLAFFDMEIYRSWSCVNFKVDDQFYRYEHTNNNPANKGELLWFILNTTLVGFNNKNYDDVMLIMMYHHATTEAMYKISQRIIVDKEPVWSIIQDLEIKVPTDERPVAISTLDTIDIMGPLVGKAGLKLYGARIHYPRLQELPIAFDKITTWEEQRILVNYCDVDVNVTEALYNTIKGEFDLRTSMSKQYGVDLRSKSGPQVAAIVLGQEYEKLSGKKPFVPKIGIDLQTIMRYKKPNWIKFINPKYQKICDNIVADTFHLNPETGHVKLGKSVQDLIINLADCSVKLAIGGLHSIDNEGYYESTKERCLVDVDVASYYPALIINSGWYPNHLGPEFLEVYRSMRDRRLVAKKAGDKLVANSLKLVINSQFGLTSNKYSIMYDPNLMINVTLSGQLGLLMLIDRLEQLGHNIISANTDGIVLNPLRVDLPAIKNCITQFEKDSGLDFEYTYYSKYIRLNVNNYFCITEE